MPVVRRASITEKVLEYIVVKNDQVEQTIRLKVDYNEMVLMKAGLIPTAAQQASDMVMIEGGTLYIKVGGQDAPVAA